MGGACCSVRLKEEPNLLLFKKESAKHIDLKEKYEFISVLGTGLFGKIRLFREHKNKYMKYAIKTLKKDDMNEAIIKCINVDVQKLKGIDHPNIIKYYDIFQDTNYLHIQMEYIKGDDLFKVLKMQKYINFSEKDAVDLIESLLKMLV